MNGGKMERGGGLTEQEAITIMVAESVVIESVEVEVGGPFGWVDYDRDFTPEEMEAIDLEEREALARLEDEQRMVF